MPGKKPNPLSNPNYKTRSCLSCPREFLSTGPGNRRCPTCTKRLEGVFFKIPANTETAPGGRRIPRHEE